MSVTKRMLETGGGADPERMRRNEAERHKDIARVFEVMRPYHLSYLKIRIRLKPAVLYHTFFPHGKPTRQTFDRHIKKAGGMAAYLTHHFYSNLKECLAEVGLPPDHVANVFQKLGHAGQYMLQPDEAKRYTPSDEEIAAAEAIEPKPRSFRHQSRLLPSIMHDRGIREFFTGIYEKNEAFYKANPNALYRADLLDYEDYLQSPFWFLIRNIVLFRDGFLCRACGGKATAVHHITYDADVLYGKNLEPLVSICEPCHELIEFDESGNKVNDLEIKRGRYESLRNSNGLSR